MFSEVEISRDVAICAEHLNGQSPHQQILYKLLQDLIHEKACREHGFYLGITALKSIGDKKNNNIDNEDNHQARTLTFPVSFTCRTFLPARGDVLQGIVKQVLWNGVFIRSGPLRYAYLSLLKMPDYHYVHSQSDNEKPYFQKDDLSKIAVGVVVRFVVLAVRFKERPHKRRNDYYVLATLEGYRKVGPISLTGSDEPYM
ncbi:PREDICTED: DNA-directed RNA polymerase subunit 7-like protein [Camelina sativa]|uniref:DNA-directed RNA polymerase subunit n=1 Tax=Camelina sativa TaxID=90675 RepID=A0ABM0V311_CAMSA|nr:PREDICTED: DNA-directed RNA polymerase subunit 7-like protein [Camelina sativa]